MKSFDYIAPKKLFDALSSLEQLGPTAKLLAGGTDLLVQMKKGDLTPQHLIDLKKISRLSEIRFEQSKKIRIGSLATIAEIEFSHVINKYLPILSQSAATLGSVQVRNKATIGGNVCHAAPSADLVPALLVLDSKLILKSLENEREVKLNKFFLSPGKTILEKNEILTEIIVPQPKEGSSAIYLKHGRRKCVDLAIVGVAVFILLDHRTQVCKDVRIALASVAPTPFRATQAEKIITNKKINESLIEECSQRALEMSRPVSDVYGEEWHKKELVKVLIRRAIRKAAALQGITI